MLISIERGSLYNFKIPGISGYESDSFYYNAILDWNSLPDSIKSLRNRESSKASVKLQLLTAGHIYRWTPLEISYLGSFHGLSKDSQ